MQSQSAQARPTDRHSPERARPHRLDSLLNPRSVALVGASERNHYSNLATDALRRIGFDGALHLVNRRGEAYGRPCATDCLAIGEPVDAAYLSVPRDALLDAAGDAIAAGIRNLVILTSGLAETGGEGLARELELKALCDSTGVRVLGPNCLGFRNLLDRVALGSIPFVAQSVPGNIALVSASGSVANFVTAYGVQQGVGFTHVVATGNEMNVTTAEIVDYLLDIPEVAAIALFLEGVKDAAVFAAVAEKARLARKPIVAIKAGAAPATAAIAAAHTSAVVGDDRVFDAVCDRYGVVRVDTPEDLAVTAAAIAATGPISRGGIGMVSMSGGMCEIASDLAARTGASLPPFSDATRATLSAMLSDLGQANNPLDLTGAAIRDETLWTKVPAAISRDPGIGLTLINWDVPAVAEPSLPGTLALIGAAQMATDGPVLIVSNVQRPVNEHGLAYLQTHGIRFALPGLAQGMLAAGRIAWWSERVQRAPVRGAVAAGIVPARPRDEGETLAYLASHGVPVVPAQAARTAGEAVAAAIAIGGTVAMKVLSPDIAHKTEIGGVRLGLVADAVEAAFEDMLRTVRRNVPDARIDGVLLAPMRSGGLELLVGVARDPHWGPVLAVGLGGIWVEALNDTALSLLPADPITVARGLRGLRAARLLDGFRGAPPVDIERLAAVACRIGDAALSLGPALAALEVNPLFVRGHTIEALDALAVWSD